MLAPLPVSLRKDDMTSNSPVSILVRGGHVVTMDPALGDVPEGDVLIEDGRIVRVGKDLEAPGATVIDAARMIVMPGFVEVHWHMWTAIWRGLSHEAAGYFALHRLAPAYTPDDHYAAVRYAATEALNAGITTCHNWSHNLACHADADAECRALADSGIRARFGFGRRVTPTSAPLVPEDLVPLQSWMERHGQGRLDLGIVSQKTENFRAEVATARAMGLKTIAPHVDLSVGLDLLGPDVIFTHGPGTPAEFMALLARRKVKIGLCPSTDPLIGAGLPPLLQFLNGGVSFQDIGFSVDVTCQASADPFSAMRTMLQSARIAQKAGASFQQIIFTPADPADETNGLMMPRQMLELATINGARVLGLDHVTGSITPGKRADIILVRTDDVNMICASDVNPTFQLVQQGQPGNVDTVLVDGVVVKRHGRLQADVAAIGKAAAEAIRGIRERAQLPPVNLAL
jgi:5-methylthioadenosine/S-adenosylhomocysteine deaminase